MGIKHSDFCENKQALILYDEYWRKHLQRNINLLYQKHFTDIFLMDNTKIYIWLADDDPDDCLLFQEALTEIPIPVQLTVVHNGARLMELLTQEQTRLPNLLLMDLNLPRENGHKCLVKIKEHPDLKALPVIILSTRSSPEELDRLYKNGAHYYIQKPNNFPELVKNVNCLLEMFKDQNWIQPSKENFILSVS